MRSQLASPRSVLMPVRSDLAVPRSSHGIEGIFGWLKRVGGLRKVKLRGVAKVDSLFTFALAAYNLVRMRTLLMPQPQSV